MVTKRKTGPGLQVYIVGVIVLALVLVVTFTIGRTTGQKSVLADTFVDNVSAKTISEVEDELAAGISQDVIGEALKKQISMATIKDLIRKNLGDAITDEQMAVIADNVISELSASVAETVPQDYLTDGQKAQVKTMITEVISKNLGNTDVNDISEADIEAVKSEVYNSLSETLSAMVQENIKNYSYSLSETDIEKITEKVNVEDVVKKVVEEETVIKDADLAKLKSDIASSVKDSIKTPVAGIDYLTADELSAIQNSAASKASQLVSSELTDIKNNLQTLQNSISSMDSKLSTLSAKVKELESSGDNSASSQDVATLKSTVNTINQNITDINTASGALAGAINIKNNFLRRLTAKNGSIDKVEVVDTSSMTIAEFVSVLSNNEVEYTTAINQLYNYVAQLQEFVGGNFTTLSRNVASLQADMDATAGTVTTLSQALTNEENARIDAIKSLAEILGADISDVNDALEAYKNVVSNTYATPDEISVAQESLKGALTQITDDLQEKYDSLSDNTKEAADEINGQISSILTSLSSEGDIGSTIDSIDTAVGTLNTSVSGLNSSLSVLAEKLTVEQRARIEGDEAVKAELKEQLQTKVATVNDALEAYKQVVSNTYATPSEIAAAKTALEESISSLNTTIVANKSILDQLDTDTKASVTAIQSSLGTMSETLENNADDIDALEDAVGEINTNVGSVKSSLEDEITARGQADATLDSKITNVNSALEAYKEVVSNTYATPTQIAAAKQELENAVEQLEATLGTVQTAAGTNASKIAEANATIETIKTTLETDGTNIEALQGTADDLNTAVGKIKDDLSVLSSSISDGKDDNASLESDAGNVGGSTLLAKIGSLWNKITHQDTWVKNVVLHKTSGTNSGKDVYRETDASGNAVYVLESSKLGLNFKENSDITIKYSSGTPDIAVSYQTADGSLKIIVLKEYVSNITSDIKIDSIHVESEN